jgi:glycerol kinase
MGNITEQQPSICSRAQAIVQKDKDMLSEILKSREGKILSAQDLQDPKKMTDTYKLAVDRNSIAMDFMMDVKNDIFELKIALSKVDRSSDLGINVARQLEGFIKLLTDLLGIIKDEVSKMDRVVRFYERNYNTYSY